MWTVWGLHAVLSVSVYISTMWVLHTVLYMSLCVCEQYFGCMHLDSMGDVFCIICVVHFVLSESIYPYPVTIVQGDDTCTEQVVVRTHTGTQNTAGVRNTPPRTDHSIG